MAVLCSRCPVRGGPRCPTAASVCQPLCWCTPGFCSLCSAEMSSPEAAKKRILPAWMTKKTAEPAEKAKMKSKRRKRTDLARTETVYCMNEAELVDMAFCILAENCKALEGDVISSEDEVQERQQELTDGHHPRTAANIAKDPPVPSTPPAQSASLSSNEETKLEEDDDALKYVREIFFT